MPLFSAPVPLAVMLLFWMMLLSAALERVMPSLSVAPFVVMVFAKTELKVESEMTMPMLALPVPLVLMVLLWIVLLCTPPLPNVIPEFPVTPAVVMVFPEITFLVIVRARMIAVPLSVLMVLFWMVLLCRLICRRMPSLLLVPFDWMVLLKIRLLLVPVMKTPRPNEPPELTSLIMQFFTVAFF